MSASFTPDGRRIFADGKIWDAETGTELMNLGEARAGEGVFSSDGRLLLGRDPEGFRTFSIFVTVDWTLTKEEFPEYQRQRYEKWVKAIVSEPAKTPNKP